jgi:hypothetical protein
MSARILRIACTLIALIAIPGVTLAEVRGGGGVRPAAPPPAARPAPETRPAPMPPQRPAAPARPAPPAGGGFNFNRDISPRPAPPPQRPVVQAPPQQPQPNVAPRAIVRSQPQPTARRFNGPVVRNAHAPSGTWGWNRGVVWRPAPVYWGGGFWGPLTAGLLFGSIVDATNQQMYMSYQIDPDTPGSELLQDYELQQTPCGPPNLVQIWGPDNSLICALPNDTVAAGDYQVDPATFTLVPASP